VLADLKGLDPKEAGALYGPVLTSLLQLKF
jgi:hypothetical protein